jgi:Uncharacterised nucleotidyltransferase
MNLEAAAQQLRLDLLAQDVSSALAAASIPHTLLKGPSTSIWLYDPPRAYRDVDLLVPSSQLNNAVEAIVGAGLAGAKGEHVGEEAPHSLLLISREGFELDLHITLPALSPGRYRNRDRVWNALSDHISGITLVEGSQVSVPVLDIPGRCLVLALHAVESGHQAPQVREDLDRARVRASEEDWVVAARLADGLGVRDLFDAGLTIGRADGEQPLPVYAYLKKTGAVGSAFGLQRLVEAPLLDKPGLLWRELFPSREFIRRTHPNGYSSIKQLLSLYVQRWKQLARQLPAAALALVAARRQARVTSRSEHSGGRGFHRD